MNHHRSEVDVAGVVLVVAVIQVVPFIPNFYDLVKSVLKAASLCKLKHI